MLTAQQITHFETFGFLLLRQAFTREEMEAITREAEVLWQEDLQHQPAGTRALHPTPFVEKSPLLAQLPEDDRIYLAIEQLLGPGFVWGGSEGSRLIFSEADTHEWHSDRAGQIDLQYTRIKIMIYLQEMKKQTGALRVIPGSHRPPLNRNLLALQPQQQGTSFKAFGVAGPDLPCFALEVQPGDVVVFNHYLYHGVYGKQDERRYIAMKFAAEPRSEEQIEALRAHGQDASYLDETFRHSQRPRIRSMVAKLLEWEEKMALPHSG
jgi:hypothetical protein